MASSKESRLLGKLGDLDSGGLSRPTGCTFCFVDHADICHSDQEHYLATQRHGSRSPKTKPQKILALMEIKKMHMIYGHATLNKPDPI